MPRVILNNSEFTIAKAGFDAATAADANIIFSSKYANTSIFMRGTVNLSEYPPITPNDQSIGYNRYKYAVVPFGKTFSNPPIVYCVGNSTTSASRKSINTLVRMYSGTWTTQRTFIEPCMFWQVTNTNFTVWNWWSDGDVSTHTTNVNSITYLVLENTIQ